MSPFTEEERNIMRKLIAHPVLGKLSELDKLAIIDFVSNEVFGQHVEWCAWLYCNDFENDPREFDEPQFSQPSKQYRYDRSI